MSQAIITMLGNRSNAGNTAFTVQSNALGAVSITPSDTTDLAGGATKGLYVGGAGNVAVIMSDGTEVTFTAIAVGVVHPISVKRVKATSTTATNIIGVY